MIALKEVRKEYLQPNGERLRVLENITFEIARGMFSSLLGPSGCGKSTILNLIAKLDRHTSGDISVNGNSTETK